LLAWTAGVVVSDAGFAKVWADSVTRPYFDNVTEDLTKAGPAVNLWDTSMPAQVVNILSTQRRLSPVLRMAGLPFRLQAPGSDPSLVDGTGRLRASHLAVWSAVQVPKAKPPVICTLPLSGNESFTRPLQPTQQELIEDEWFVKIGYFSRFESHVRIELLDDSGRAVALPEPPAGWPAGAGGMYFGPSPRIRATSIRVRSTDPRNSVCVTELQVGIPVVTE
jgi:hypothetical protein